MTNVEALSAIVGAEPTKASATSSSSSPSSDIDNLLASLDNEKKNAILKYVLSTALEAGNGGKDATSGNRVADDEDSAIGKIINCALSTSEDSNATPAPNMLELSADELSPERLKNRSPSATSEETTTDVSNEKTSAASSSSQESPSEESLDQKNTNNNDLNTTMETTNSTPFKGSPTSGAAALEDCSVISNVSETDNAAVAAVATAALVATPQVVVSRKGSRHISESDVHSMNISASPSVGDAVEGRRRLFGSKGEEDFEDCRSELTTPLTVKPRSSSTKSKNLVLESPSTKSYTWKAKTKTQGGDDCSTLSGSGVKSVRTNDTESSSNLEEAKEKDAAERVEIHDMAIYTCVYCALIALVIGYTWVYKAIKLSTEDGYWTRCAWFAFLPLITGMMMFPFKLVFFNILSIFGSWRNIQKNSKYHSAFPPPVPEVLPPVCVQMPVYKESFDETILPSLISIYKAIDYYTAMGGDAHMFVNDDGLQLIDEKEREERIRFYHENEIAYIARPSHDILKRHGLFKKASNMNFCLNFATDVQKAEEEFGLSKQEAIQHVIDARPYPVLAGGPIGIGTVEYILLVDSDTRVPEKCLYQTVGEFIISPTLGFIQHTMSVLRVGNNYWEEMLAHWTWTLYNLFIPMGTANGEPAPLVGHNATLNWRLVKEVSTFDEEVNYRKFWSESHVSEDFDLSLRLQSRGYIGRYALYCGMGFQEGVSLTVFDEIIKLKKFAYGAGEMMFNKFRYWCWKGPFAPLIKDYLTTKEIPLAARVNMVAYFFTFFAMAWGVLFLPLSFFLSTITPYEQVMATAWENYIGVMLSFLVVGTSGTIVLKFLMGIYGSLWAAFIDEIWRAPLIAVFYAGVQWHMFTGFFRYMLDMKAEWGATVKELDDTDISFKTFYTEVKNTVKAYWFMYLFPVLGQMGFFIWFYMFGPDHIHYNGYVLAPFFSFMGAHFLMPILLNPSAMRCVFGWIPGVICCWCRRKEAAAMKKKMNNNEYNTLHDSLSIGKTGHDDLDQMELGATQTTLNNTESANEDDGHRAMTPMETFLVKEKIKAGGVADEDSSGDLISGYATPDEKEPQELLVVEDPQSEDQPKQEEEPSPAEIPSEDVVESTPPAAETDDAAPPSEQEVADEQEEQVTSDATAPISTSEPVESPTSAELKDEVVADAEIQEKEILPTNESPSPPVSAEEEIPNDAPQETERDEEKKELSSGDDDKKDTTSINENAVVEPQVENADTQKNQS